MTDVKDTKFNAWPLIILCNAAALSLIYANAHGVVGRFGIKDNTQGAGNTAYAAVVTDFKMNRSYPLFDLQLPTGEYAGLGVVNPEKQFCVAVEVKEISK